MGPEDQGRVERRAVDQRAVKVEVEKRIAFAGLVEQGEVQAGREALYMGGYAVRMYTDRYGLSG